MKQANYSKLFFSFFHFIFLRLIHLTRLGSVSSFSFCVSVCVCVFVCHFKSNKQINWTEIIVALVLVWFGFKVLLEFLWKSMIDDHLKHIWGRYFQRVFAKCCFFLSFNMNATEKQPPTTTKTPTPPLPLLTLTLQTTWKRHDFDVVLVDLNIYLLFSFLCIFFNNFVVFFFWKFSFSGHLIIVIVIYSLDLDLYMSDLFLFFVFFSFCFI